MKSYVEFINIIRKADTVKKVPEVTDEMRQTWREVLSAIPTVRQRFELYDEDKDFFGEFPDFEKSGIKSQELFYQNKLGYFIEGVPSKIVYILQKAIKELGSDEPNTTLYSVYGILLPFAYDKYNHKGTEMNLLDIVYAVFKHKFEPLTNRRKSSGDEYYVYDSNLIAILPKDIQESVKGYEIKFDKKVGLYIEVDGERTLLRTMNKRIGVTRNDLDLRESL